MENGEIADVLSEIGSILEIKGENPFKIRAYFNAARAIESTTLDIHKLIEEDRLGELNGVGESLKEKITELVQTGRLTYHHKLKKTIPPGLLDLLAVPGLGPKKIKALYEQLNVTDLDSLEKAARDQKIETLEGFGKKTEENILEGIEQIRSYANLHRYGEVIGLAREIEQKLKNHPDAARVGIAGSLRRGKEIVKDIDIIVSSEKPKKVMEAFVQLDSVERITNHGETKSSVLFKNGIPCDLRIVSEKQFPYALHHFTGSKEHNIAMRQMAVQRKMKMSEWGLFKTQKGKEDKLIPCKDEAELFQKFGMDFIPPELRENLGEIEAAQKGELPKLIEWDDIRGTFHCHTDASDGQNTLEEMAKAAKDLGWDYLGIADHSKSATQANGLNEERLFKQIQSIQKYNQNKPACHLFAGVECDILKDGKLDFDDDVLKQLDYVVASVHSLFNLSEKDMTKRIIRAIENPYVTILGHVTGRLLLQRKPYELDLNKIIDSAAETGTWIELNAHPYRLDMDWRWWKHARDKGVRCVITPDAHSAHELSYVRIGVNIARKGWLRREDVINSLPRAKVLAT